jgi:MoxR-like ATPase
LQCTLGYVSAAEEAAILADQTETHPVDTLPPAITRDDVLDLMSASRKIRFSDELRNYVVALVGATRGHPHIQLAASPRASLSLMKVSQALALFEGHNFVSPELIQSIAADVIAHRLVLTPEAKYSGISASQIVADLIENTPVPA